MHSIKLSVLIPVYNEQSTILEIVERVQRISISKEVIIIDDGSTDGTRDLLQVIEQKYPNVIVIRQTRNLGKGKALRSGFAIAQGEYVIVQDADLEYDPLDYYKLIDPLEKKQADVVYGSRLRSTQAHRVLYFWHYIANKILTFLCNMLTNLDLTDMETCFKVFRRHLIQSIELQEDRFGFEPEITCKLARINARIYEVGIAYHSRTYREGKKIKLRDAFRALWCILLYSFKPFQVDMKISE